MRNYLSYGLMILGAVAVVIFMRMGRPVSRDTTLVQKIPEAPADQLPPSPNGSTGAFVNKERIKKLAESNYKGPSYTENYDTPEVMMAAKVRATGRLPASNPNSVDQAPGDPMDGSANE